MTPDWKTRLKAQRPAIVLLILGVVFGLVGCLVANQSFSIPHAGSETLEAALTRVWIGVRFLITGGVLAGLANVAMVVTLIRKKSS
jgi:hypothetical protein